MKTLYYKFLLFVVVAALAAPFVMRDSDGRPLMSLEDLSIPQVGTPELPDMGSIVDGARRRLPLADREETAKTRVYKWRDADGVWHFSDSAEATGAEAVELDPDANLVRYEAPADQQPEPDDGPGPAPEQGSQDTPAPLGGSLEQAPELVERARQVDQLLKDREARQRRTLDRL